MAEVCSFRGVRYAPLTAPLQSLICPPYDVITPRHATELLARSPFNAIRVEMPTAEGDKATAYERAKHTVQDWLATGVLAADPEPALYVLTQRFTGPDGLERTRRGFLARVRLEEHGTGVRPHELTHAGPKADRLALLRATRANLSPIFMLYDDRDGRVAEELEVDSAASARDDDGTFMEVGLLAGERAQRVCRLLAEHSLLIADGHHRYATALAYREERRALGDTSADFILAYLCSMRDPGLEVFPAHRLLKNVVEPGVGELIERLQPEFELVARSTTEPAAVDHMVARVTATREHPAFALVLPAQRTTLLVRLRERPGQAVPSMAAELADLPVTILHHLLLPLAADVSPEQSEDIFEYEPRPLNALARLESGGFALGAFLAGPTVAQVDAVSRAGLVMPQKATYFFPKVPSGVVFNLLDELA